MARWLTVRQWRAAGLLGLMEKGWEVGRCQLSVSCQSGWESCERAKSEAVQVDSSGLRQQWPSIGQFVG